MARLYLHPWIKSLAQDHRRVDQGLRKIEIATVGAVWAAARRLDIERASALGGVFGALVGPRLRKHRHVLNNLRVAFPQADDAWVRAKAKDVWRQIGRTLAEYPHIDELCRTDEDARVSLESEVPLEMWRNASVGHVFVAMHQANWNLPAMAGALGKFPLDVIYAEQKNPAFEKMIATHRNRMPCGFIHVNDVPRKMIGALKRGRNVGLFVDHRIDQGDPIAFFGQEAQTTTIPARIACKLGTGLVPTRIERLAGVRFHLTLAKPVYADSSATDLRSAALLMMRGVHRRFEQWILEQPADWCCVKRRWPKPTVADIAQAAVEPQQSARSEVAM